MRFHPGDLILYDSRYPLDTDLLDHWSAFNVQLSEEFVRKWVPPHAELAGGALLATPIGDCGRRTGQTPLPMRRARHG